MAERTSIQNINKQKHRADNYDYDNDIELQKILNDVIDGPITEEMIEKAEPPELLDLTDEIEAVEEEAEPPKIVDMADEKKKVGDGKNPNSTGDKKKEKIIKASADNNILRNTTEAIINLLNKSTKLIAKIAQKDKLVELGKDEIKIDVLLEAIKNLSDTIKKINLMITRSFETEVWFNNLIVELWKIIDYKMKKGKIEEKNELIASLDDSNLSQAINLAVDIDNNYELFHDITINDEFLKSMGTPELIDIINKSDSKSKEEQYSTIKEILIEVATKAQDIINERDIEMAISKIKNNDLKNLFSLESEKLNENLEKMPINELLKIYNECLLCTEQRGIEDIKKKLQNILKMIEKLFKEIPDETINQISDETINQILGENIVNLVSKLIMLSSNNKKIFSSLTQILKGKDIDELKNIQKECQLILENGIYKALLKQKQLLLNLEKVSEDISTTIEQRNKLENLLLDESEDLDLETKNILLISLRTPGELDEDLGNKQNLDNLKIKLLAIHRKEKFIPFLREILAIEVKINKIIQDRQNKILEMAS
jgi:hypothetical protein